MRMDPQEGRKPRKDPRRARRRILASVLLTLAGTTPPLFPTAASAQAVSAADSAAVLLNAAARLEARGDRDPAKAVYRLILRDFGDTPAAAEARRILASARSGGPARSGRVELMVWATTYGAWLGIAIPSALGSEDSRAYGTGLVVGGPAGLLSARALARRRPLTTGQARAITLGGTWGTWQGFGWAKVLDLGVRESCSFDVCYAEDDFQEVMASMIVGGLAGIAVGSRLSRKPITPGVATTVNFGSLWGTWFGFAASRLLDLDGDALLTGTLLGGNAGLLSTALLAPGWKISRNRARLISIAGVLGGLAGAGIDMIVRPDDERVAVAIPLVTSVIGLASGVKGTAGYDDAPSSARGDSPEDSGSGAVVSWRRGSGMRFDAPVPFPTLVPSDGPDGPAWKAAVGVTLFRAVF